MLRKVAQLLTHNMITARFLRGPAPRWAVFGTDVLLVWVSAIVTLAFNSNATPDVESGIFSIWTKSLAVTAIYALFMLILGTYRSVIRLSTFYDTYQVASR